jgi:S-adenosylmethionine hydrolase
MFQPQPPAFKIVIGKQEVTSVNMNYAEGAPGEVFGILGSMGYLEIAANRAAAVQLTGASKGSEVNVILEGAVAAGNGS